MFAEKILIKDPSFKQKKKVGSNDKFILNQKYTNKKIRVKIHTVEKIEKQK